MNLLHLSRLLNAVMQMLFPFCKPFQQWLVRPGAVQQRSYTSWSAHLPIPVRQRMAGGPTSWHRSASWWGDWLVFSLSDHLWLQGLTHLKAQSLGILIRISTDFNQQGPNEMTEALIIARVTAAQCEGWYQLFKATSCSPLPLSSQPNSWRLSILTSRDTGFLFVCREQCKHDFLEAVCAISLTELEDISLISAMAAGQYHLLLNLKIKCWCLCFRHHNSIPTLILLLLKCILH